MSPTAAYASRVKRFPWPFTDEPFAYGANLEPAGTLRRTVAGEWGATILDLDEHYGAELAERRAILARDATRYMELPHMRPACWDALIWTLHELSARDPQMRLERSGEAFLWTNGRLGVEQAFRYGEDASLPAPPLVYLASQIQEDIVLLDQREGKLWVDAGCVTFASNWSLAFDIGMSFLEIHGPVPHDYADGAIPRAEQFLMRLQPGQAFRRLNWTTTAGARLDTALDSYADWGASRAALNQCEDLATTLHMRVEVQHLIRLPQSGAVMFLIRTYLLPLSDILATPDWRRQFAHVLATLAPDILQYKGLTALKQRLLDICREASEGVPA
jgi:hypothetical protein